MTPTSFGLALFVAILLPTMSMVDKASGQGAETTEENNISILYYWDTIEQIEHYNISILETSS